LSKKFSLQKIIKDVLTEKNHDHFDGSIRGLRRSFDKLLKKIGAEKEELKNGGRIIEFSIEEVAFIKAILIQLYDREGLFAQFLYEKSDVSSRDIRDLIESVLDEEDKRGASEEELALYALFLDNTFCCGLLYSIENCLKNIEMLKLNLQDLPYNYQKIYFSKVEHILRKEVVLSIAGSAIFISKIAEEIELLKQQPENDIGLRIYNRFEPEIRDEYIQRDKSMLKKIQEDDDLRYYIERKIGKKAEEIFNYATLSKNN